MFRIRNSGRYPHLVARVPVNKCGEGGYDDMSACICSNQTIYSYSFIFIFPFLAPSVSPGHE